MSAHNSLPGGVVAVVTMARRTLLNASAGEHCYADSNRPRHLCLVFAGILHRFYRRVFFRVMVFAVRRKISHLPMMNEFQNGNVDPDRMRYV